MIRSPCPPDVRAELIERLAASLAVKILPEITHAQLAEVRRRIAQVESGEAVLIPGDEALARVRTLLANIWPAKPLHVAPHLYPELSCLHEHHC